jgi:hypothetical protein
MSRETSGHLLSVTEAVTEALLPIYGSILICSVTVGAFVRARNNGGDVMRSEPRMLERDQMESRFK